MAKTRRADLRFILREFRAGERAILPIFYLVVRGGSSKLPLLSAQNNNDDDGGAKSHQPLQRLRLFAIQNAERAPFSVLAPGIDSGGKQNKKMNLSKIAHCTFGNHTNYKHNTIIRAELYTSLREVRPRGFLVAKCRVAN